jgi:hypothetical protein
MTQAIRYNIPVSYMYCTEWSEQHKMYIYSRTSFNPLIYSAYWLQCVDKVVWTGSVLLICRYHVSLLPIPTRVFFALCFKIYWMESNVRRKSGGGTTKVKRPSALHSTSQILLFLSLSKIHIYTLLRTCNIQMNYLLSHKLQHNYKNLEINRRVNRGINLT